MADTKPVQIDKNLHRELRELAGWSCEKLRSVAERGIRAELDKIICKRDKSNAKNI